MAYFNYVGTSAGDTSVHASGLSDLDLHMTSSGLRLFQSYQAGGVVELRATDAGSALVDTTSYATQAGLDGDVTLEITHQAGADVAIAFGAGGAGVAQFSIATDGTLAPVTTIAAGQTVLGCAAVSTIGGDYVYTTSLQSPGISVWQRVADGSYVLTSQVSGSDAFSGFQVVTVGGENYLLGSSATSDSLTNFRIDASGKPALVDQLSPDEGLWVAAPDLIQTAEVGGHAFALLASPGTGSISVIEILNGGGFAPCDQVNDELDTRFASIAALKTVSVNGHTFVIAGGADDGLTLMQLLPNGKLLHLETIADSNASALTNVTAIEAMAVGTTLEIFASGEGSADVSHFQIDLSGLGDLVVATSGATATGSAGDDVLIGAGGSELLQGGAGRDILIDSAGSDQFNGGAGADTFVFSADGAVDTIQDFEIGIDRIDLSGIGTAYTLDSFTFAALAGGIEITFKGEVLRVYSSNGHECWIPPLLTLPPDTNPAHGHARLS